MRRSSPPRGQAIGAAGGDGRLSLARARPGDDDSRAEPEPPRRSRRRAAASRRDVVLRASGGAGASPCGRPRRAAGYRRRVARRDRSAQFQRSTLPGRAPPRGLIGGARHDPEGDSGRAQGDHRRAPEVRSAAGGRHDRRDDPAQGRRGVARTRLARLHRALRGHGGALRHRHRRGPRSCRRVPLPRQPLALGLVQDRMTRVVVSGLGVVSPYGAGAKTLWAGLARGTCAIRPLTAIDTEGFRSRIGAEVPADELAGLGTSRRRARADRLALAAAREALADADLSPTDRACAGLFVGAVGGGMFEAEEWYWEETRTGRSSRKLRSLRSILPWSHAEMLGFKLGLGGPKETIVMACASGAASIALGLDLIRSGAAPLALCGGVDALTRICFMGFNALRLLDPEPCRPFDRNRKGMSIGEGAAFLVLEDSAHCRERGGRALAELLGAGMTTDAHHVTAPEPGGEGMIRAMRSEE